MNIDHALVLLPEKLYGPTKTNTNWDASGTQTWSSETAVAANSAGTGSGGGKDVDVGNARRPGLGHAFGLCVRLKESPTAKSGTTGATEHTYKVKLKASTASDFAAASTFDVGEVVIDEEAKAGFYYLPIPATVWERNSQLGARYWRAALEFGGGHDTDTDDDKELPQATLEAWLTSEEPPQYLVDPNSLDWSNAPPTQPAP